MSSEKLLEGKTILLVNPGSLRKKFILERTRELGVKVVCLSRNRVDFAEPYVDEWILAELNNHEECLEKVSSFISGSKEKIAGVITFWDECIILTAKLAATFGWVGVPVSVAEKIKNKFSFRQQCREVGAPAPASHLVKKQGDIPLIAKELVFPLVIKPVYGASSAFVIKVQNQEEALKAFLDIQEKIHTHELSPDWPSWDIVAEEYIDGDEVDIDIIIQNGELKYGSVTDNDKTAEPYFVETGESAPSNLASEKQSQLLEMAGHTLNKLGVKDGCVHFEAKMSSGGPVPVEVNLRMGGGDVYLYSKMVWGVDLVGEALKVALAIPVILHKPPRPLVHLSSRQFLPTRSGVVKKLVIDETIKKLPFFVELYFQKKVGDAFLAPPYGYDSCLGWFTASGTSPEEAKANVAKGMKLVHYELSSGG